MRFILGLTGPTGSGKSTACRQAENMGWRVIDCDKLAREATNNRIVLNALADAFGNEIINTDGSLNRKILASRAFENREQTELLNKTILPFIVELIKQEIDSCSNEKIILDAPTLYESGADALCNEVCAILSCFENRIMRITKRDNITIEEARLRISAGKEDEYYKSRTGYIIYNDKGKDALINDFTELLKTLGGN